MKKLGLALGGGGIKGLAHIGVLQVLKENQIPVSVLSGTSAGSIIAALYASGMSPYTMAEIAESIKVSDYIDYNTQGFIRYLAGLYLPFAKTSLDGVVKGERLEKMIYRLTGGRNLQGVKLPLAIIACDIDSGRKVVFTNYNLVLKDDNIVIIKQALLSEAVRASSSIPATFVPLRFRGMQMVDGGVREIVPVSEQKLMGAEYILAVNLGQETYYQSVLGIPQIISRTLNILTYETSDLQEEILADLIIYPGIGEVKLTDIDRAGQIIRAGRRAMKNKINQLKKGLGL